MRSFTKLCLVLSLVSSPAMAARWQSDIASVYWHPAGPIGTLQVNVERCFMNVPDSYGAGGQRVNPTLEEHTCGLTSMKTYTCDASKFTNLRDLGDGVRLSAQSGIRIGERMRPFGTYKVGIAPGENELRAAGCGSKQPVFSYYYNTTSRAFSFNEEECLVSGSRVIEPSCTFKQSTFRSNCRLTPNLHYTGFTGPNNSIRFAQRQRTHFNIIAQAAANAGCR